MIAGVLQIVNPFTPNATRRWIGFEVRPLSSQKFPYNKRLANRWALRAGAAESSGRRGLVTTRAVLVDSADCFPRGRLCRTLARGRDSQEARPEEALACLGATTFDVHLNEEAYWANVPAKVWAYSIGGYQVIKKWLSYREYALLGRPLSAEEARSLTETTRRLTALRLLEPALDANYNAVRTETYPWPQTEQERA